MSHHGRLTEWQHLQGVAGGSRHRILLRAGLDRGGLAPGEYCYPGGTGGGTTFGLANSLETIRNFDKRVFADRVLENHIFPLEIRKLFKFRKFNNNV